MKQNERIVWAFVILAADMLVFLIPVTAVFAAYVLIARPPWFRDWIRQVYEG